MIGIPPSGTKEAAEFCAAFWPALYSGLLYSIVTGIIVGVIVLMFQHFSEKRITKRSYARDLSIMKQQVRDAISCPDPIVISSAAESAPQPAIQTMKVIRQWPVSLWREELSTNKVFLNAIHELQLSYSEFDIASQHLDFQLKQFARLYNCKIISANDPPLQAFIFGKLRGIDSAKLALWLDMPDQKPYTWIEEGSNKAETNQEIVSAYRTYKEKRENLEAKMNALIQQLNT